MAQLQYYGIKYPFTSDSDENFYVDVNHSLKSKVRSELLHIIFTPKGQKLRDPEFGTDLIKYIFKPNDDESWDSIKTEISESVSRLNDSMKIKNIEVLKSEDDPAEVFVRIDYSVKEGNKEINDSIVTKL